MGHLLHVEVVRNTRIADELRGYNMSLKFLYDYEKNRIYPVEIFE